MHAQTNGTICFALSIKKGSQSIFSVIRVVIISRTQHHPVAKKNHEIFPIFPIADLFTITHNPKNDVPIFFQCPPPLNARSLGIGKQHLKVWLSIMYDTHNSSMQHYLADTCLGSSPPTCGANTECTAGTCVCQVGYEGQVPLNTADCTGDF